MWKHHVNLFMGVSTKLSKYIVFTMQTYKKLNNDNDLYLHSMTKLSGWLRY